MFLLPLVAAYELALAFFLQVDESVHTVVAHRYLLQLFDAFNIDSQAGLHLGGIAIILVVLTWHLLNRDPWRVKWNVVGVMAIESALLIIPLLVIGQLVDSVVPAFAPAAGEAEQMSLREQFAISIGAGLYEELVFRMLLIAVIHTLLVDIGKASHSIGAAVAVVVSAAAFMAYHPLQGSPRIALFYLAAGLYLGGIYVSRGFGIAVGTHAFYDLATVVLKALDGS